MKSRQGFTLVEMMATVLIFTVMTGALLAVVLVGSRSWQINITRSELQEELRRAVDWINNDMSLAGPGSIGIGSVPVDNTWYTSITFQKTLGAVGGVITWDPNSVQYILGGVGNNQLQRITGGQVRVLAQNIQTLQFQRQTTDPDVVLVFLQAQKSTNSGDNIVSTLNFEVQMRN